MSGVPRQTGADDPALSRPEGLRADWPQSLARAAGALRHARDEWAKRLAAQQVSVHAAGRRTGSGYADRRAAPSRRGAGARAAAGPPAGVRSAAPQRQRAAAGQPVVDAAGGPAGAADTAVSEVAAPATTAGGCQSSAGGPGTGEAVGAAARPAAAGQRPGLHDL